MKLLGSLFVALFLAVLPASAQSYASGYYVRAFAGSEVMGYQDGVGVNALFSSPLWVVADAGSNLYVWDAGNGCIRKIATNAAVTTFATLGTNELFGMTIDANTNLWCLRSTNLLEVTRSGSVLAGPTNLPPAPEGLCLDSQHNFYFTSSNQVWKLDINNRLSVFAGSGRSGITNGAGTNASFDGVDLLAAGPDGTLYACDYGRQVIRKIDTQTNVTLYAGQANSWSNVDGTGTNALFYAVIGMAADNSGNLLVTTAGEDGFSVGTALRKIDPQTNVTTLAGDFSEWGFVNGQGSLARFTGVQGLCSVGGTVYACDLFNNCVRSIGTNALVSGSAAVLQLVQNRPAELRVTGSLGRTYEIQVSADLSYWASQATLLISNNPSFWIDPQPVSGDKFYRAVLLP
jgi:sugar lactone lactonase YvrE